MTRQKLIAGNWKMQLPTSSELLGSRDCVLKALQTLLAANKPSQVTLAVFPPLPFLADVAQALAGSPILWGAQNVFYEPLGAFTGEVAPSMLTAFDCRYVLVGHSERRQLFGETNEIVAKKFKAAQEAGLVPVLCVGETLAEREAGATLKIVQQQLASVFNMIDNLSTGQLPVVAYEPVWAIGTGRQASPEQAQEVHAAIRRYLAELNGHLAEQVQILYGGSVKPDNASGLLTMPDIDGALVGGASLNIHSFLEIAAQCKC